MASLVAICEPDVKYDFQHRQVPIEVDNMKMVIQFTDKCVDCEKLYGVKQRDLEHFTNKFNTLTKDEVAVALLVSGKDIMSLLSHMVPCVGCRKSVERLFYQLQKSQHPALEPLVITPRGELSVQLEYLFDPRSLFALFHVHGSKLHSVVESISKGKKNKRCNLHSLETHKSRTLGCWLDAWDALSETCREKVLVIDMKRLLNTVDSYLDKHKFCGECKSKVMLAYNILIGEVDSTTEKGYCAALYENLRCCAKEKHVHVLNDTEFIAHLLEKAEPEFLGGKRDRHAKTLDIAQEEVLTCLGIHIFERLHCIWQKLRSEEQTWLILFYMGVDALRKSYQAALEEKQGASNLELLCEELEEKEKRQEVKKEMKRQKKKQKKAKTQHCPVISTSSDMITVDDIPCQCSNLESEDNYHHRHSGDANFNSLTLSLQSCELSCPTRHSLHTAETVVKSTRHDRWEDPAEVDSCESCSMHGSNEGSEEGECSGSCTESLDSCECDMLRFSPKRTKGQHQVNFISSCHNNKFAFQASEQPSLQDLLDELCWEGDGDDPGISEEEILEFKARQVEVESKRQKLRQSLRQRFEELHMSRHLSTI
ncbi:gametogenetin-binding protein 2 [Biomphalaria pfeifferi]|uniref:Gametogenetin-binding protein 2 n=1 Tax=Biomphalaria pfeifferi TaxID=112525 RepID=A0AAD8BTU0_BIOPF|nr:gametogenetin-binding protein 2 [Biomphalaria pfeifferi]